ncbi:MAG: DNA mismatch repair protein MutS [Calditrichaeota bacterium]|nr:MAG: DNA mismatch repair protein MutS [Calditrichota bacterium]
MEQYLAIKAKYQDMILLYRMGDFYETFYQDAQIISRVLGIALTKRSHGKVADVPLAGFPYHALNEYLPKLVQAGYKVAICEQVEDPKLAKTVVKREVVEVVTPGTALSEKLLDHRFNNYLAAVYLDGGRAGISFSDFSTGEFFLTELPEADLLHYLQEISPREILVPSSEASRLEPLLKERVGALISPLEDWIFSLQFARDVLLEHFQIRSLKAFGIQEAGPGVVAAGAVLQYGKENFPNQLAHIVRLSLIPAGDTMILDATTRRNLEITQPLMSQRREGTLISILDETRTPMGARLLKFLVTHPLIRLAPLKERLARVSCFFQRRELRQALREHLGQIGDLERLFTRLSAGRATPRDLIQLKNSLKQIQPIRQLLEKETPPELATYRQQLDGLGEVVALIEKAIVDNPPLTLTEGNIIKEGFDARLDEYRQISRTGKQWIVELQARERERTGIPSLKVGYNKVFGYYLEVTRPHLDKVPEDYIRKQTLANAERFITPELKDFEEKVLTAEEKMAELEYQLFQQIRQQIVGYGKAIQRNAGLLAELDCWTNFAHIAEKYQYVEPEVNEGEEIFIEAGRHPVVERLLPPDQPFIPNDTHLDSTDTQIMVITGPNMAGKSTYLRQVGLIVLLAQIGCFVPARQARIGLVDRIFTRVGASDNLAFGESTFMVEMLETANILHNATPRSLILLDEIGRGTSTFDGLSIAWAVTEYLHNHQPVRAKTLFATHYHELTELASIYPRIKNFKVAVKEYGDQVVFLHRIEPGGMDNSYGIHVAQMAGLPREVVERAREVLQNLEANELSPTRLPRLARRRPGSQVDQNQLSIFDVLKPSPVEEALQKLDINQLTPLQALIKLDELKKLIPENSSPAEPSKD